MNCLKSIFIIGVLVQSVISWPDFYYYPKLGQNPIKLTTTQYLNTTSFDYSKATSFVIHGFSTNYLSHDIQSMGIALLNHTDDNVILVDWGAASGGILDYPAAFINMHKVGKNVSIFITNNQIDTDTILCVGHSLGAHACGFAGKHVRKSLKRIIGLDPAGPLFDLHSPSQRLNSTDAKQVHVVHTSKIAGIVYGIGHKDFWPNHGLDQPGCDLNPSCDHQRAIHLFVESTENSKKFKSTLCTDGSNDGKCSTRSDEVLSSMGYFADHDDLTGSFFLRTNSKYPYSRT